MPSPGATAAHRVCNDAVEVTRIALRGRRPGRRKFGPAKRLAGLITGDNAASALQDTDVGINSFIAGPENRLVGRVIGELVGKVEGRKSRPFDPANRLHGPITLVGPSGSGKTHLAHGLAALWQESRGSSPATPNNNRSQSAAYLTASDFGRQFADAIDAGEVNDFRRQLRKAELLVIDDLHRVSASPHSQQELLHTVDALNESQGLTVFTTVTLPADIIALSRPLISRLASGIVLEIAPLGAAARAALLKETALLLDCQISDQALTTLADQLPGDPPRLLSVGVQLRQRFGKQINEAEVEKFLDDAQQTKSPPLKQILATVARYYGVTQKMLTSSSRRQTVVLARAIAIYLARSLTPLTYQDIGRSLGGRDHTTILHNFRRIETGLKKDRALRLAVNELRQAIEQASA